VWRSYLGSLGEPDDERRRSSRRLRLDEMRRLAAAGRVVFAVTNAGKIKDQLTGIWGDHPYHNWLAV